MLSLFVSWFALATVQSPDIDLFEPVTAAVDTGAVDATVRRARTVRVSQDLVAQGASLARGDVARVELFDGRAVSVRCDSVDDRGKDGYLWQGTVLGVEAGSLCLAFQRDVVAGSLRIGTELFSIRTARSGVQILSEIDEGRFPACATGPSEHVAAPETGLEPFFADLAGASPVIDVMVVYTPQAKDAEGGTAAIEALIDLAVAETNQAYEQSDVAQRLRLVHTEELVGYTETASFNTELARLTSTTDGWFDGVHAVRDQYGADAVAMIVANAGSCGIAWQMGGVNPGFHSLAFSVTSRVCAAGNYTFGHELGHNMGCAHDRDTALSTTRRVSVTSGGGQVSGSSSVPRISSDSRYMAFYSDASDLVPGDGNGSGDVFSVALTTSERILASKSTAGVLGNGVSWWPVLSADGRYVAFQSEADNLVALDTNGVSDVFVRDTWASTTTRVSVGTGGVQANGASGFASISDDGRYVAFESDADDLVALDTNGARDVFVHDLQTGTTVRASVSSLAAEADGPSNLASISGDGTWVAFQSGATNLVASDLNGAYDVFVRGLTSGTTFRASVDSAGVEGNQGSGRPSISADGNLVAFQSDADNLIGSDTNALLDVFVRDVALGTTTRASEASGGGDVDGPSHSAHIAGGGSVVAFESDATNLVADDTNGMPDVFAREIASGTLRRLSVSSSGKQANATSGAPTISANGRYVGFLSNANNLVPADSNLATDIFTHDRQRGVAAAAFTYSYGYRTPSNAWRTIMAYEPGTRIQYFSNPNVSFSGEALGVADPDPFAAENWKSLNATAATVAAWRESLLQPYCFGDGLDSVVTAECPCGNFGEPGRGCANSNFALGGALLCADGTVQPNTVVLTCEGVPNNALCTFLRGTLNDAAGAVFGDGVKCAGGTVLRFGQQNSGQDGNPSNTAATTVNTVPAGNLRYYQCHYRNPNAGFCPPGLFNISNGVRITW